MCAQTMGQCVVPNAVCAELFPFLIWQRSRLASPISSEEEPVISLPIYVSAGSYR